MKKIVAMMMAVMMLIGLMTCAQAAPSPSAPSVTVPSVSVPSITTSDVTATLPEGLVLEASAADADTLKAIVAFAETNPVIDYFGQDVVAKATALLPEGTDLASAQLDEFMTVSVDGYETEAGDIEVTFECVTAYEEDDVLLAVVGYEEDGATVWEPLETRVDNEGKVVVTFTQEVLEAMNGTTASMALLRMA